MFTPEVVQVTPMEKYIVEVLFQDGKIVHYDVNHLVGKGVFALLRDENFYKDRCTVLNRTLAWDVSGNYDPRLCIDIDPDILYALSD